MKAISIYGAIITLAIMATTALINPKSPVAVKKHPVASAIEKRQAALNDL
ncbi:hypothetical protein ACOTC5_29350 [Achromobacter xylosoxidans]